MAGYLFSNKKLRDDLGKAKDAEAAAAALAKHLKNDGKKVGGEVQKFIESDPVQKKFRDARTFAKKEFDKASQEVNKLVGRGKKTVAKAATKAKKTATKKVKKATKAVKKTVKRATTRKKK